MLKSCLDNNNILFINQFINNIIYFYNEYVMEKIIQIIKIVGWIHVITYILKNAYGFYSFLIMENLKELIDKYYIIVFLLLSYSWILCRNECLISYIVKKIKNSKYQLGEHSNNYEDMLLVFNGDIKQYEYFQNMMIYCYIYSLIIANKNIINEERKL